MNAKMVERASVQLHTCVFFRNKVVEGFQELMRMPV